MQETNAKQGAETQAECVQRDLGRAHAQISNLEKDIRGRDSELHQARQRAREQERSLEEADAKVAAAEAQARCSSKAAGAAVARCTTLEKVCVLN
jgi:chromosome segregation ATPase